MFSIFDYQFIIISSFNYMYKKYINMFFDL